MNKLTIDEQRKRDFHSAMSGKPNTFDDAVHSIMNRLGALMISKQHDYGPRNITDFGEIGCLIRANDKMARLKNLLKDTSSKPKNESIEDSWTDLANYAIIALMLREGIFELPLKK